MKNLLLLITIGLVLASCTSPEQSINQLHTQVAEDAYRSYEIAAQAGDWQSAYVQAGIIQQSYLQAENTEKYKEWTEIHNEIAVHLGLKAAE